MFHPRPKTIHRFLVLAPSDKRIAPSRQIPSLSPSLRRSSKLVLSPIPGNDMLRFFKKPTECIEEHALCVPHHQVILSHTNLPFSSPVSSGSLQFDLSFLFYDGQLRCF